MRVALAQMTSSDDPGENLATLVRHIGEARDGGAEWLLTPEVTNCVSTSRRHQREVLHPEAENPFLEVARETVAEAGIWLLIGSLAVKTTDADGRFANRSLLIAPDGTIRARYDKIHMFDVAISESETFRESDGFRPGDRAILAETDFAKLGLSVCYDLRFADLYRRLAQAGADILTIPAAFSPVTGAAHWEPLLRARAIETGCFVLAPAQSGTHSAVIGKSRETHGHSMVVAPWGEVLLDAGTDPGLSFVDLDLNAVGAARARVPSLTHDRPIIGP